MFSIMDFLPTFANIIGGKLPTDRPIDGVDQTDVLLGKSEIGNRDSLLTFIGADMVAARWKQWRMYFTDVHPTGIGPQRQPGMFSASAPTGRVSVESTTSRWTRTRIWWLVRCSSISVKKDWKPSSHSSRNHLRPRSIRATAAAIVRGSGLVLILAEQFEARPSETEGISTGDAGSRRLPFIVQIAVDFAIDGIVIIQPQCELA